MCAQFNSESLKIRSTQTTCPPPPNSLWFARSICLFSWNGDEGEGLPDVGDPRGGGGGGGGGAGQDDGLHRRHRVHQVRKNTWKKNNKV
jgi:hypothetical protein